MQHLADWILSYSTLATDTVGPLDSEDLGSLHSLGRLVEPFCLSLGLYW